MQIVQTKIRTQLFKAPFASQSYLSNFQGPVVQN